MERGDRPGLPRRHSLGHGIGTDLLGFERTGSVQNVVPVLLTLLLSLSTDYEVFLLSRVREVHRRTGDGVGSVARGPARTAR